MADDRKPRPLDLIYTGTARCATGFFALYTSSAGLRTGHEKIFNVGGIDQAIKLRLARSQYQGESSWLAAPWLDCDMLKDAFAVHLVRHPKQVIESWMRSPTEASPAYLDYAARRCPRWDELEYPIDRYAHRYVCWNRLIEEKLADRPHVRFDVARDPREMLVLLKKQHLLKRIPPQGALFGNTEHNKHGRAEMAFGLDLIHDAQVRAELEQIAADYGYMWPEPPVRIVSPVIKAIITSLDNLPVLKQQIAVLDREPVAEVVVVNNGSTDGTREWLDARDDLTCVHKLNHGAGPGRNAGLDAARQFDYALMLDGGVLPARGSVDKMLTWLDPRPGVTGIGVEIDDLRTDYEAAWLRWTEQITRTYRNYCLSHTGYGLFRWGTFDGRRFREDGPWGKPGWGGDDNEFAYQLRDAGLRVFVVTCGCRLPYFGAKQDGTPGQCIGGSVHAYRRAGGSWSRIKRETGLEPWGEGSVYEERCVCLQQHWPQYDLGEQRDEPWLTLVVKAAGTIEETATMIKNAHHLLYRRKLMEPGKGRLPNPYSVILWLADASDEIVIWARQRHLRRHYGKVATVDGEIVYRNEITEPQWAGDFRLSFADNWKADLRPGAYLYAYAETAEQVGRMIWAYNQVHPRKLQLKRRPGQRHRRAEIQVD